MKAQAHERQQENKEIEAKIKEEDTTLSDVSASIFIFFLAANILRQMTFAGN